MTEQQARPHAIIIGASSGVGAACASRFSLHYRVTGISRRGTLPEGLSEEHAVGLPCDATSSDALKTAVESAVGRFGKISLMVVAAGMQLIKPVRNLKEAEIHQLLGTNVAVPVLAASLFASQRFSHPDAVLCLVSSIAAQRSEPGIVLYAATKAATSSLVQGLAKELSPRRVVGVAPGWLDTPMTQAYAHVYTPEFVDGLKSRSPLGLASVDDVVDSIEFLASGGAKKVTGQVLVVDGGASL